MKRVALHNLGCKVNAYEMDYMQQTLQEKGWQIVPFDEEADIYIVNTCTVTNIADRKSRQMLHRAKKCNPDAVVVAVGCYVQTGEADIQSDGAVDLAIGNNRKKDLPDILEAYLARRRQAADGDRRMTAAGGAADGKEQTDAGHETIFDCIDINAAAEYEEMTLKRTAEHTRAYIKIQDGCNQFCSYCIIPYARGRVRSRRQTDILTEVRGIAAAGYREIVLTGIHISSYGIDRGGCELLPLLAALSEIEGIERIRLGSLEPRIVTEDFAGQLRALPKVCPHFHLSLQSGCDTVLRRMNRHYDTAAYYGAVGFLRKYYGNPAVTTDVIVGFPGETEEEFAQTEDFLRRVGFYEIHIFKYSRRRGTRAAAMDGQLTESEKGRRSERLMTLTREMSRAYRQTFFGQPVDVLFEEAIEQAGKSYFVGHTPYYVRIAVEALPGEDLRNRVLCCMADAFLTDEILLAHRS